jgi:hypothetical protein
LFVDTIRQEMLVRKPPEEALGKPELWLDQASPPSLVAKTVGVLELLVPTAQQCSASVQEMASTLPVEPEGNVPTNQSRPKSLLAREVSEPLPASPMATQCSESLQLMAVRLCAASWLPQEVSELVRAALTCFGEEFPEGADSVTATMAPRIRPRAKLPKDKDRSRDLE